MRRAPPSPVPPAPEIPRLRDFAETVEPMRRLQQTYFCTRDPQVLSRCKSLERQVDGACRQILLLRGGLEPSQPVLFDQD